MDNSSKYELVQTAEADVACDTAVVDIPVAAPVTMAFDAQPQPSQKGSEPYADRISITWVWDQLLSVEKKFLKSSIVVDICLMISIAFFFDSSI